MKKSLWLTALVGACLATASCSHTAEGVKEDVQADTPTQEQMDNAAAATKLTPAIKAAIVASPILNDSANSIDVDTSDSKVTLTGYVKDQSTKDEAEKVVKAVLDKTDSKQTIDDQLTIGKP